MLTAALEILAAPVVKAFMTDLTTHDRNTLSKAHPGDCYLWAPYESGTVLCKIRHQSTTNPQALSLFRGTNVTVHVAQWYRLDLSGPNEGTATPITRQDAEQLAIPEGHYLHRRRAA